MSITELTKLAVFAFDTEARVWKVDSGEHNTTGTTSDPLKVSNNGSQPKQLPSLCRIATLNVLSDTFPGVIELAIKSKQRLQAYTKGYTPKGVTGKGTNGSSTAEEANKLTRPFADVGTDILALNEVSLNISKAFFGGSDDVMSQCGFRYMTFFGAAVSSIEALVATINGAAKEVTFEQLISHLLLAKGSASIHAHGCLITSKFPITQAWRGHEPREVYVEAMVPSIASQTDKVSLRPLVVCSRHTVAYATMETKAQRSIQIKEAAARCRQLCAQAALASETGSVKPTFVLLGDLNLHDTNEDQAILGNNLVDPFAAVNEEMLGHTNQDTFSPSTNPMIKRYIPAETRHMRLDRILLPAEDFLGLGKGMESEGNSDKACVKYLFASPLKLWADTPIDVAGELTLSDHFGLYIDLALVPTQNNSQNPSLLSLLGDIVSKHNSSSLYPGKDGMEKRAALPSDQCNRRVGVIANAKFFSNVFVCMAFSHIPWVLGQYWARYKGQTINE